MQARSVDPRFLKLTSTTPAYNFLLSVNMTLVSTVHNSLLLFKYVERNKFYIEVNQMK